MHILLKPGKELAGRVPVVLIVGESPVSKYRILAVHLELPVLAHIVHFRIYSRGVMMFKYCLRFSTKSD